MDARLTTKIVSGKDGIRQAAGILRAGGICAIPTETVYGLAANCYDEKACANVFSAKGRPQDNPLIIHIADPEMLEDICMAVPEKARLLMKAFWPGPLSLVLPKSKRIPDTVSAGLSTVAVRMPDNEIARSVIREAQVPLAAPSANRSGRPSPTTAQHVLDDMGGRIPLILDGGACTVGVESTVVDMTKDTPVILRPGDISEEELRDVAGEVAVFQRGRLPEGAAPSPGMKYVHYSPKALVKVFSGSPAAIAKTIRSLYHTHKENGGRPVILCPAEEEARYAGLSSRTMGSGKRDAERAVFTELRRADTEGFDLVLFHYADTMGEAVRDRISRAAGCRVLKDIVITR